MKRETQIAIWQFILAFKKATGEHVNYLDLVKKSDYLEDVLERAKGSGDTSLANLALKIEDGLDDDHGESSGFNDRSESILLSEAPDEIWAEPASSQEPVEQPETTQAVDTTDNTTQDKSQEPAERYAYRLGGALKRAEFSLLHRRALDRFAHKHHLQPAQVHEIETRTRESLRLAPLNWGEELQSVIADLRRQHDTLTTLKVQLHNTYVRSGRLDEETFQRIYAANPGSAPEPQPIPRASEPPPVDQGSRPNLRLMVFGGIAIALVIVVSLL